MTPELLRFLLRVPARLFYRIRAIGRGRVPAEGPVLLVANHVSFIDPVFIAMAMKRVPRFLMFRAYYDLPLAGRLFRAARCIPVSSKDGPKALAQSFEAARAALRAGEAVCIFAEGEISRHGQMLRFKKGYERIVEGLSVPVVPVHLDQVWGSVFSFEGGRAFFKRPRRFPYPVTVSFGDPLPSTTTAFELRQAILELGAEAFRRRLEEKPPLGLAFAETARAYWRKTALEDASGARLAYGQTLRRAWALGKGLARLPGERVGVAIPPSIDAALVNLALVLRGRAPVNLDDESLAAKAGVSAVVTGVEGLEEPLTLRERLLLRLSPGRLLPAVSKDAEAAVLFPAAAPRRAVALSHNNVLANIEAVAQVCGMTPEDAIAGVLPFSLAFGFTHTLWMPLTSGMSVRFGTVEGATVLLGTPSLLKALMESPPRDLRLRLVISGNGRLSEEDAAAFEARLGLFPYEGWGRTEMSPAASVNIPDIRWPGVKQTGTKPGSVGQPLPGVFIKEVDGILWVKGPNVARGYLDAPEATAAAFKDGFFVTGDRGAVDEDGFVTLES